MNLQTTVARNYEHKPGPVGLRLETHAARELFLFGPPGKKRILNIKELVKQSGASERAIREHLPEWRRESEEMAAASMGPDWELQLSSQSLEDFKSDVEFLRRQVDGLRESLQGMDPGDPEHASEFKCYLSAQRAWSKMSGIDAALDAAAAGIKQREVLRAKAADRAARETASEPEPRERFSGPDMSVFGR